MNNQLTLGSENAPGFPPALYIPTSCLGPGLSRPTLQRGGMGGYPPSLRTLLEGGPHQ